ncbi:MAG TPA: non-homologous end-joining DNA ligase [Mycobacteriales bacterium]|nr:non-homologous end-joining DNA ligase [Mycobacteriales bacterium]
MPPQVAPMLATAGALPAADDGWAFEPKWDGIRAITRLDGDGGIDARSRNGQDLTAMFPELSALVGSCPGTPLTLDGELVALDEAGIPRFGLLQQRLNLTTAATIARRADEVPASYIVFDVLFQGDRPTTGETYDERRARLEQLTIDTDGIVTSQAYRDVPGADVFQAASSRGLEGVVAKRRLSTYRPGARSTDWIKVKAMRTQEVVIGGWLPGQGRLCETFGALLLGVPDHDELVYAGKVGTGFDERTRARLFALLKKLATDSSPFATPIDAKDRRDAQYVEPEIVGEVQFGEWTGDGRLRHPSWRGVRPDKSPRDVRRE